MWLTSLLGTKPQKRENIKPCTFKRNLNVFLLESTPAPLLFFLSLFIYLLRHKTVQTNDKLRRFGVVMTPSSMKVFLVMQITAFKAMWRET